jgi:AcrR family transcriptional regulator
MEAIAAAAGVGKPAIYRRFRDKAGLVASVIAAQLPALDPPDLGDTRAELWQAVEQGFPADGAAYVGLIGGLIAEQERHPELIDAFRSSVLLPRRETGRALIQRGQERGDLRRDIDPEAALDLFAGPFLARVFAGLDTGPRWRRKAFATWWDIVKERQEP